MTSDAVATPASARRILFASLAGTAIEFYDFYIYANAAILVFPALFFPRSDPAAGRLQSLLTFALAFMARPVGSALFGHFGDRIGRKATLVAALLTMGLSTVAIGLLPTYAAAGILAPILLALCRVGQGLGLGGEWGGAILLATENAPPGRRGWYGMFPQLGAPLGFALSGGMFMLLSGSLSNAQFLSYGWRIPFLASSVLVILGLYVRLRLAETPAFQGALRREERVPVPLFRVARRHAATVLLGTAVSVATFVLFYLLTVFCMGWSTGHLGYSREQALGIQMVGVLFFAAAIPCSALVADRLGRRAMLVTATVGIGVFGLVLGSLFTAGLAGSLATMIAGFALMGLTYGPLGTVLSELYPTPVRYTGTSLSFNLAGIAGGSLTPLLATALADRYGLRAAGWYLAAAAALTLAAIAVARETRDVDLGASAPPR
jgi:metabolite-proton symporter